MAKRRRTRVITVLIPLPVFYNADEKGVRQPVEDEKFIETAEEIAHELRAGGTLHVHRGGNPTGFWWDKGIIDRDVLAVLEVDVEDTARHRGWFRRYARDVLLERFRQKAIYLKFVGPIERVVVQDVEVRGN